MVVRPPIPPVSLSRRSKIVIAVVIAVFLVLTLANSFVGVYIDWLWFGEVHHRGVFRTIITTRVLLVLGFGLIMALVLAANIVLAYMMRPPFRPMSPEQQNLERYRIVLESRRGVFLTAVLLIAGLAAGLSAQANWQAWLLWLNGGDFGVTDPQFHMDISFYAFDYPIYRTILGFGLSMVILSFVVSAALHYLFGSIRLQTPGPKITPGARRHLTVLVAIFFLLKAAGYWLDRYGLLYSDRGKVTGASYTDVHASLPAKTILFWVALIIAVLVFASLWLRSARVPLIAFVSLVIVSILINGIYPALVQQFTVKPNASDKESLYIKRNIDATRQAYDVVTSSNANPTGTVTYTDFDTSTSPSTSELKSTDPTVSDIRILDPNVVSPTFAANQQLQNFYGFPDKLDIDRYTLKGADGTDSTQDYVVGMRELVADNLTSDQRNWINKRTVYTHGYGFVAAAANTDVTNNPQLYTSMNIPVQGPIKIKVPQVYYGELGTDYVIVGAKGAREYDGDGARSTYEGTGGISLDNIFTRLAFATQYRETNFLLNDAVTSKAAKMMIVRDPRDRVQKVAPFLKVDGDPYPVVDQSTGHMVWMVDAYTTMGNYPYSEKQSLASLTNDSLTASAKTAAQPDDQVNYIRNSVKATVDAYDGTVTLYQWDDDPLIKAWSKAMPGLLQPKSAMPASLLAHVRYPQDLFEAQRSILQQYHVDDPVTFYNQLDKWTVPTDPTAEDSGENQPPYYVVASSPTKLANPDGKPEFQLTSPMMVNARPYLAAYISVNSDPGPDYGKMTVLRLSSSSTVNGPPQVFNQFNTNTTISKDLSLLSNAGGGSKVIHGNLLTLPIGNSFLFVEPLYVKGTSGTSGASAYPVLQRVMVAWGDKVGYGTTLAMALKNLDDYPQVGLEISGGGSGASTTTPSPSPTPTPVPAATPSAGATAAPTDINGILSQLDTAFANLQAAYKSGDYAKIGAAEAEVARLTQLYQATRASAAAPTPTAAGPS